MDTKLLDKLMIHHNTIYICDNGKHTIMAYTVINTFQVDTNHS